MVEQELSGVKIGDKLVITRYVVGARIERELIAVVEGITKSGNIKAGGCIFCVNGAMRGQGAYSITRARKATKEDELRIKKNEFTQKVFQRMRETTALSISQAIDIAKILGMKEKLEIDTND